MGPKSHRALSFLQTQKGGPTVKILLFMTPGLFAYTKLTGNADKRGKNVADGPRMGTLLCLEHDPPD
jgi:hypothetical protein